MNPCGKMWKVEDSSGTGDPEESFIYIYIYLYFWLPWVFSASCGLSLAMQHGLWRMRAQ